MAQIQLARERACDHAHARDHRGVDDERLQPRDQQRAKAGLALAIERQADHAFVAMLAYRSIRTGRAPGAGRLQDFVAVEHMPQTWPQHWPLAAQVVLALAIAELGLYAAHRIAHEWPAFWRFHALHHSVTRLWVVNTGRFHIVDTCFKAALGQLPLYLLGAPLPVFLWISAVTAITGLLTHCNVVMRTGPLDFVFSTPALHRWHHSRIPAEGNRNYGENFVLWDQLFGTYFNPPRRPPADIGIDGTIAKGFLLQLAQPFSSSGVRAIMGDAPPGKG